MCGYTDVVKDEDGKFRCVHCKQVMDEAWAEMLDIALFGSGLKPPPLRFAAINEAR